MTAAARYGDGDPARRARLAALAGNQAAELRLPPHAVAAFGLAVGEPDPALPVERVTGRRRREYRGP